MEKMLNQISEIELMELELKEKELKEKELNQIGKTYYSQLLHAKSGLNDREYMFCLKISLKNSKNNATSHELYLLRFVLKQGGKNVYNNSGGYLNQGIDQTRAQVFNIT